MLPKCWKRSKRFKRMTDLSEAIRSVLLTGDVRAKVMDTRALVRAWRKGDLAMGFTQTMPDRPCWPDELKLLPPRDMPRRGGGGILKTQIALWHSLAHIEFVAIDLALDMAGRFGAQMGRDFVSDFLSVAADEAMHFALINRKLAQMGAHYGQLPAHGGLWQAAMETAHDVSARLAIVPMVLEARGLDVTPAAIVRVRASGDEGGARILERILDDEIRHVRIGTDHFNHFCENHLFVPQEHWKTLVSRHFRGRVKPPFNDSARLAAGLSRDFYGSLD